VTLVPAAPNTWPGLESQRWELFDTENDPSECHDLASEHPETLQELIGLWWHEAGGTTPCRSRRAMPWRSSARGPQRRQRGRRARHRRLPGTAPWAFAGGTIHKAIIDVSGEQFADLAQEAQMAFARD
jgi:arylsulfatase